MSIDFHKVQKGECAWMVATNILKQSGNKPTGAQIIAEMKRLATLNNCNSVDEFNKKFFSSIGLEFKIKDNVENCDGLSVKAAQAQTTYKSPSTSSSVQVVKPSNQQRNATTSRAQLITANSRANSASNANKSSKGSPLLSNDMIKKIITGNVLSDKITVNGVTHYKYIDCIPQDIRTVNGIPLHKDAANAFKKMQQAAKADGVNLFIVSGYRSSTYQKSVFKRKFQNKDNPTSQEVENRIKVSAPSGFSEHHTGLAIDICSDEETFENTKEFKWLKEHASEYGFEMSFPKNNVQGLSYEPWHWRFVGNDDAKNHFACVRKIDNRFRTEYV